MKTITKIITALAISLGLVTSLTIPAFAEPSICENDQVDSSVKAAAGCTNVDSSANTLSTVLTNIITAIIAVLGIVAVIFIVIGGINYMTSSGDAGKLQRAKSTIIYACIGLVISALAFALVNFTVSIINSSQTSGEASTETGTSQSDR